MTGPLGQARGGRPTGADGPRTAPPVGLATEPIRNNRVDMWISDDLEDLEFTMTMKSDPAAALEDIRKELQVLRTEMTRLGGEAATQFGAAGSQAINEITHALRRMNDVVASAGERGRGMAKEIAGDVGRTLEGNVRSLEGNVRAHPLGAIAVAIALGFVLGTLTRR